MEAEGFGAIILAGGESRRMGQDKGLMPFHDRPMVAHVIAAARAVTPHIVIVANHPGYEQFGYPVIADRKAGKGPLGGLCTGLAASEFDMNLVLSCDVPLVTPALLAWLGGKADGFEATVVQHGDNFHPLIGVYARRALAVLEGRLENGQLRLRDAVAALDWQAVDPAGELAGFQQEWLMNFNSPSDLAS